MPKVRTTKKGAIFGKVAPPSDDPSSSLKRVTPVDVNVGISSLKAPDPVTLKKVTPVDVNVGISSPKGAKAPDSVTSSQESNAVSEVKVTFTVKKNINIGPHPKDVEDATLTEKSPKGKKIPAGQHPKGVEDATLTEKSPKGKKIPAGKRRPRHVDRDSFKPYIYKVMKIRNLEHPISRKSMDIMDDFMKHMFEVIATEAGKFTDIQKRKTLLPWDIEAATRIHLTGELGLHAISEGTKALKRFTDSKAE